MQRRLKTPSRAFRIWLRLMALYILYNLLAFIPYYEEFYGRSGVYTRSFIDLYGVSSDSFFLTNLLPFAWILFVVNFGAAISLFLIKKVRTAALLAFICTASFNFIGHVYQSPEIAFVNLSILLVALYSPFDFLRAGKGKPLSSRTLLHVTAWACFSIGYFVAGIGKFGSEIWRNGDALARILEFGSVTRAQWPLETLLAPRTTLAAFTYLTLVLELGVILAVFFTWTRTAWFYSLTFFHLTILLLMDLNQVSLGMLLFHGLIYIICFSKHPETRVTAPVMPSRNSR